jgi:DUF4097 and DUF4098 domain-containing protein YvlB
MHRLALAALLLAPLTVFASPCKFEAPRNLQLDLAGVKSVQISVHSQDLHVTGDAGNHGLSLTGRACASDQSALEQLQVTQQRDGDQLRIDIGGKQHTSFSLFGSSYAGLEVTVKLPASMPLNVSVGSGDADVRGVAELQSIVGSGDLHVHQVAGKFSTSVGSGDVDAADVGSLDAGSVGSGDLKVAGVKGDAKVGSIGSGDVTVRQVGGSVDAGTLGSGDLTVSDVGGSFTLGAKGSGDVNHSGVKGKVSVPHDDD